MWKMITFPLLTMAETFDSFGDRVILTGVVDDFGNFIILTREQFTTALLRCR